MRAVHYLERAADAAVQRSAFVEVVAHVERALELLPSFRDAPPRVEQELRLLLVLGRALVHLKGGAAPETGRTYARARVLSRQLEDASQRLSAVWGLWNFSLIVADLRTARELSEEIADLAGRVSGERALLDAHRARGITLFYLGDVVLARAELERGVALYDALRAEAEALPGRDPDAARPRGRSGFMDYDSGVSCRSFLSCVLWLLGYPDQALRRAQEAVALAREAAHPPSLAYALLYAARVHQFRREAAASQALLEELIAVASRHDFAQRLAQGRLQAGWTAAEQGAWRDGVTRMRESLAAYRATGGELGSPIFLAAMAEALGKMRQTDEATDAISRALHMVEAHDERWWEADVHRVHGELLCLAGCADAGAEALHRARDLARRQQARSLELRATASLARLWLRQGRQAEARARLAEIQGWFTEGFTTGDWASSEALRHGA